MPTLVITEVGKIDQQHRWNFLLDAPTITVRDLLREYVHQEILRRKQSQAGINDNRPEMEKVLNPVSDKLWQDRDYLDEHYAKAEAAFAKNGVFVIVNGRQVGALDDHVPVNDDTEVQFFKLTPLVGG